MSLENKKSPYILLTPGPLSTSPSVRSAMWYDSCTWDKDYKSIVTEIRTKLLAIAKCNATDYTSVLMQGSGTFGVEAVLGSSINRRNHKVLILDNGVYGRRMAEIAKMLELPHRVYSVAEDQTFDLTIVKNILEEEAAITHIAVVHCETTTGLLNDIASLSQLASHCKKYFIVDAMSSFAGIEFDMTSLNIDFLISSANKCIQGVPGFSFVVCKKNVLSELCKNNAKSLSLDLYGQWNEMEKDAGKWRFTSPTHVILAFHQALLELEQEGGVMVRAARYRMNQSLLADGMTALGYTTYISDALQSPIITTFLAPTCIPGTEQTFVFADFYQYLKSHGFVIYPGKVTNKDSFRIGNIGHLFPLDVATFLGHVDAYRAANRVGDCQKVAVDIYSNI